MRDGQSFRGRLRRNRFFLRLLPHGAPRLRAFVHHLAWAIATLLLISIVVFAAMNIGQSPSAQARQALGRGVPPGQLMAYVREHNLDDPLPVRYGRWMADLVQGDFGVSSVTQRPVRADVMPRLKRSVILALAALIVSLPISLAVGVYMARRYGGPQDLTVGIGLVVLSAMPEFVVAILLLFVFAVWLGVLPIDSSGLLFGDFAAQMQAYVLPVATLTVVTLPYIGRITRAAAHEALSASYARSAVLRGLPRRRVVWNHAMRNAAVSIINAVGLNLIYLLGGVIVVENVFGFPGVGQALITAIGHGDVITVQAISVVLGAVFIVISLTADLVAVYFNPRLRAESVR